MMRILSLLLFWPHILLYLFSEEKDKIVRDLYSRKTIHNTSLTLLADLSYELFSSRYFRTLFYFRINNIASKVLKTFYKPEPTFIIDVNTKLGAGVRLAHPYATILNAESIGENLYVNHLVTVGEIKGKKPTIGNNVELHANSTVIGGIKIGDDAVIGAGAVVIRDVPPGAVAVGNPARIILRNV